MWCFDEQRRATYMLYVRQNKFYRFSDISKRMGEQHKLPIIVQYIRGYKKRLGKNKTYFGTPIIPVFGNSQIFLVRFFLFLAWFLFKYHYYTTSILSPKHWHMPRKKIYPTLGERIRLLRKQAKMTQESLARSANVSYVSLVKIEQGKTKQPSFQTVYKIAHALGLDINVFAQGTEVEDEVKKGNK